jgi:hypothetical protein
LPIANCRLGERRLPLNRTGELEIGMERKFNRRWRGFVVTDCMDGNIGSFLGAEAVLPHAVSVSLGEFKNRYAGRACHIVGRGSTDFDYEKLGEFGDPIFFINDAVGLERHARAETFFFAHDPQMAVWLNGEPIKSTAVLPINGEFFRLAAGTTLNHRGRVVYYRLRKTNREALVLMNRDQIARIGELYTHSGTIHSALHFVWFCGFRRVQLIGCDCIGGGHDGRLENRSGSPAASQYDTIRRSQDLLMRLFGLQGTYVGTPKTSG